MPAARRSLRAYLTGLLFVPSLALPATAQAFGFNDVAKRAEALAAEPWQEPKNELPKSLRELSYDQYRDIRFRPERALWRRNGSPFEIQFFHAGFFYSNPVKLHVVTEQGVQKLKFRHEDFDYGANKLDPKDFEDMGYAGFRVHYPVNSPRYKDEIAVFLGASYFRALGKNQLYGLSARGLAVDTALMSGEEFPAFTEFWLVWPAEKSGELEIYALLESKRVTGAYRFVLRPGNETQMEVRKKLFPRSRMEKIGVAPLTSMYFFGENQPSSEEDYRPEVHDSDGLLLNTSNGEWVWRPLVNPRRLLVTSFELTNPRGFGLMQRDRSFDHYQDLEARYERRPSAWITPKGDWGKGRVELVQIPTPDETNDNIVAYWVPAQSPEPGQPLEFQYRLNWQLNTLTQPPLATVVQSRRGHGYRKEANNNLRFIVDFDTSSLKKLGKNVKPEAAIWASDNGEILEKQSFRNEANDNWRVSFLLKRKNEEPVEMRVTLRVDDKIVSETWSYVLP
jgi:periplasmic glucans biosynthesis protein